MYKRQAQRQARFLSDLPCRQAYVTITLDTAEGGGGDLGAAVFGGKLLMASGLNFHGQDVFRKLEINDEGGAFLAVTKDYAATMRLKRCV